MVRYMKQRDSHSCGPVAIMNVLKWAGSEFSYNKKIKPLKKLCRCMPENPGTLHADFDRALRTTAQKFGSIHVRRVQRPKLWQIEEHLHSGGVVVMNYRWKTEKEGPCRHFMLLAGIYPSGKFFLTINDHREGPAAQYRSRRAITQKTLRFQRTDPYYKAWFISRRD